jgi:REP element-mobilizing transposase RayT
METEDYERFLTQLAAGLAADGVILYAYVLMPNHYHLLVETPLGNVQKFMQRLNTAYGMYFRYKRERPGHCFQGRYGAKLAAGDDYLLRLTRYIHLNPVKVKRLKAATAGEKRAVLNGYRWSSYRSYVGLMPREEMVDYRWLDLMGRRTEAGKQTAYREYAEGFLGADDDEFKVALDKSRYALGDAEFCAEVEEELKAARMRKGIHGRDVAWPEEKMMSLDEIEALVCGAYRVGAADIRGARKTGWEAKKALLELAVRYSGKSQREIAGWVGYTSESSVGKQRKAFQESMAGSPQIRKRFARLCALLWRK